MMAYGVERSIHILSRTELMLPLVAGASCGTVGAWASLHRPPVPRGPRALTSGLFGHPRIATPRELQRGWMIENRIDVDEVVLCKGELKRRAPWRCQATLQTQANLGEILHNQVILAAVTASLSGQILKPFTSALQGKGFNWKLVLRSGGMPSAHSAVVTSACTSLALERGLADSLFGLSVMYAAIVMYDAQGVRRAVGKQAEVINSLVIPDLVAADNCQPSYIPDGKPVNYPSGLEPKSLDDSESPPVRLRSMGLTLSSLKDKNSVLPSVASRQSGGLQGNSLSTGIANRVDEGSDAYGRSEEFFEITKVLPSVEADHVDVQEIGQLDGRRHIPLKESVGHTKLEVFVGGLWGIFITIALSQFVKISQ